MAMRQIRRLTPRVLTMMEWLLTHPGALYVDCARELRLSKTWVSIVVNSPLFQEELRRRQRRIQEHVDESVKAAASAALDRLTEQLEQAQDPWLILNVVDKLLEHCTRFDHVRQDKVVDSPVPDKQC